MQEQAIPNVILAVGNSTDSAQYVTYTGCLDENYDRYFDNSDEEHTKVADCGESVAPGDSDGNTVYYSYSNDHYRGKVEVRYFSGGFYFSLSAKLKHQKKGFLGIWSGYGTTLRMVIDAKYKPKCKFIKCESYYFYSLADSNNWVPYVAVTRPLHDYYFNHSYRFFEVGGIYDSFGFPILTNVPLNVFAYNYTNSDCF